LLILDMEECIKFIDFWGATGAEKCVSS